MEGEGSSIRTSFRHYRYNNKGHLRPYSRELTPWQPTVRGGMTQCDLIDEDGHTIAMGQTVCSFDDVFCYETGRQIAHKRAVEWLQRKLDQKNKVNTPG